LILKLNYSKYALFKQRFPTLLFKDVKTDDKQEKHVIFRTKQVHRTFIAVYRAKEKIYQVAENMLIKTLVF
jgi:hypothetical protein